jgi:hypothetical protein
LRSTAAWRARRWATAAILIIMDVSGQGLRRPAKMARLMQGDTVRDELTDVHVIWLNEGRFTLAGFERQ